MQDIILTDLPFQTSILAGQLALSSQAMYKRDFKAYCTFAQTTEQALQPSTLARWANHLALYSTMSPNTINRMISAVKRIMKTAASQGYISQELALSFSRIDGVKLSSLLSRTRTTARTRISPEQMKRLTDLPDTNTLIGLRDSALLHTLASSGLRASELATLTIEQIRKEGNGYLLQILGKNDIEYRDAHLSPTAYQHIQNWLAARPYQVPHIFTTFKGRGAARATNQKMSPLTVWLTIKKYAELAGIENAKPHDFRRFVGTQLAKKDIRKAQKALGHKRIETTTKYDLSEIEVGLTDNLY